MFGPGMHPRSLVHVTALEEGVCDGKTQFRAERATGDSYYSCCQHHDDQCLNAICHDFCRPANSINVISIVQYYSLLWQTAAQTVWSIFCVHIYMLHSLLDNIASNIYALLIGCSKCGQPNLFHALYFCT